MSAAVFRSENITLKFCLKTDKCKKIIRKSNIIFIWKGSCSIYYSWHSGQTKFKAEKSNWRPSCRFCTCGRCPNLSAVRSPSVVPSFNLTPLMSWENLIIGFWMSKQVKRKKNIFSHSTSCYKNFTFHTKIQVYSTNICWFQAEKVQKCLVFTCSQ